MEAGTKKIMAVVALIILTGLLSILPEMRIEKLTHTSYNYYIDLAQHSMYYLALTMVFCWIFSSQAPWKIFLAIFGLSLVLECAQYFAPGRSFSIHDIVMNLTGTSIGMLLVYLIRAIHRRITFRKMARHSG